MLEIISKLDDCFGFNQYLSQLICASCSEYIFLPVNEFENIDLNATESEQLVQEALDRLLNANKNITTVIVAHRLQTVRNADLIAVVQDGRVVEVGNHDSLMNLERGYYRSMVDQALGDSFANT